MDRRVIGHVGFVSLYGAKRWKVGFRGYGRRGSDVAGAPRCRQEQVSKRIDSSARVLAHISNRRVLDDTGPAVPLPKSNRMIKLFFKELESHFHTMNQQVKLGSDPNRFEDPPAR